MLAILSELYTKRERGYVLAMEGYGTKSRQGGYGGYNYVLVVMGRHTSLVPFLLLQRVG